jgi:hypothetical protein
VNKREDSDSLNHSHNLMLSFSEKDFQVSKDGVVLLIQIQSVGKKMALSQVIEPQTLI